MRKILFHHELLFIVRIGISLTVSSKESRTRFQHILYFSPGYGKMHIQPAKVWKKMDKNPFNKTKIPNTEVMIKFQIVLDLRVWKIQYF